MEPDLGLDTVLERSCRIDRILPDAVRTTARQPLLPVVAPPATARRALAGRPLHSKRAVRKPRNKSYGACVFPGAKHQLAVIVRPRSNGINAEFASPWGQPAREWSRGNASDIDGQTEGQMELLGKAT